MGHFSADMVPRIYKNVDLHLACPVAALNFDNVYQGLTDKPILFLVYNIYYVQHTSLKISLGWELEATSLKNELILTVYGGAFLFISAELQFHN